MSNPTPTNWLMAPQTGADGDSPGTIVDSIAGNNAVGGSAILRVARQNGRNGLEFDGSADQYTTPSFMDTSYNTACTVIEVCELTATDPGDYASSDSTNNSLYFLDDTSTPPYRNLTMGGTGLSLAGDPGVLPINTRNKLGIRVFMYDGSGLTLGFNALYSTIPATGNLDLNGAGIIVGGFLSGSFFAYKGIWYERLQFNQWLTMPQLNFQLERAENFWDAKPFPIRLHSGNSQTSGVGTATPALMNYAYFEQQDEAGEQVDFLNLGMPSVRAQDMISVIPLRIKYSCNSLALNASRAPVAYAWEFYNEFRSNGHNLSAAEATMLTYFSVFRDAGFDGKQAKLLTCAILPSTDAGSGVTNFASVFRTPGNAWLRTLIGTAVDGVVPWDTDPTIGPDAAFANPLYSPDGIHATAYCAAQQGRIAQLYEPTVSLSPINYLNLIGRDNSSTHKAVAFKDGKVWNGSAYGVWADGNFSTYGIAATVLGTTITYGFGAPVDATYVQLWIWTGTLATSYIVDYSTVDAVIPVDSPAAQTAQATIASIAAGTTPVAVDGTSLSVS